jgi:ATP-dependent Lon protease
MSGRAERLAPRPSTGEHLGSEHPLSRLAVRLRLFAASLDTAARRRSRRRSRADAPRRASAAAVGVVFLFTTVTAPRVEATFWGEQRRPAAAAPEEAFLPLAATPSGREEVPLAGLDLPSGAGQISESYWPPIAGSQESLSLPLVIHVQDAHGFASAQENASRILAHLAAGRAPVRLVAVEGAWGPLPVRWLSDFPDKARRDALSRSLLRAGSLTGEEYLAVTRPESGIALVGVEQPDLYLTDLLTREDTRADRDRLLEHLGSLAGRADALKPRLFSDALRRWDALSRRHRDGGLPLSDYVRGLTSLWPGDFPSDRYPQAARLRELLTLEAALRPAAIDRERLSLVERLSRDLSPDALSGLAAAGVEYRLGRLSPRAYHERMLASAAAGEAPELRRYLRYLEAHERLDPTGLGDELQRAEHELADRLAGTAPSRKLLNLSRWIEAKRRLLSLAMSPEEWRQLPVTDGLASWSSAEPALAGLEGSPEADRVSDRSVAAQTLVRRTEPMARRFYELALERDSSLVANTLRAAREAGADRVVLVAGGFHTPGITRLLRQAGSSYVVVRPNLRSDFPAVGRGGPAGDGQHSFHRAVRSAVGTLRETSRLQERSGRQVLAAQFLGLGALSGPADGWRVLRDAWAKASPGESGIIDGVDFLSEPVLRDGRRHALGVIRGGRARVPFLLWNAGTDAEPDLRMIPSDGAAAPDRQLLDWLSAGPAENLRSLPAERRRALAGELRRLWPHLLDDGRALESFLDLASEPAGPGAASAGDAGGPLVARLRDDPHGFARLLAGVVDLPVTDVSTGEDVLVEFAGGATVRFETADDGRSVSVRATGDDATARRLSDASRRLLDTAPTRRPLSGLAWFARIPLAWRLATGAALLAVTALFLLTPAGLDLLARTWHWIASAGAFGGTLAGSVYITPKGPVDTLETAYDALPAAQKERLAALVGAGEPEALDAAAEILRLVLAFDEPRAGSLYASLGTASKQVLLRRMDARLAGRLLSGYHEHVRLKRIDDLRDYRDDLARDIEGMRRSLEGLRKPGATAPADAAERLRGDRLRKMKAYIDELESQRTAFEEVLKERDIPVLGVEARQVSDQAALDKRLLEMEIEKAREQLAELQKAPQAVAEQVEAQIKQLRQRLNTVQENVSLFAYPSMTLTPDKNRDRVEAFIQSRILPEVRLVQKALYRTDDGPEKIRRVWEVFRAARELGDAAQGGVLRDLTARARIPDASSAALSEIDGLPEYGGILSEITLSVRQGRERAISVSVQADQAKDPLRKLLARRLLTDARYGAALKGHKVLEFPLNKLSPNQEKALQQAKQILQAAEKTGDVAFVVDLDVLRPYFFRNDVDFLEDFLTFWQGLESPPALVALSSQGTHQAYVNNSTAYAETFGAQTVLKPSAGSLRLLLGEEAKAVESFNDLKVSPDVLDHLVRLVRQKGPFDLGNAVRVLQSAASAAEMEGSTELTLAHIEHAMDELPSGENLSLLERYQSFAEAESTPEHVRAVVRQEIKRLERLSPHSPDRRGVIDYLDHLLRTPWTETTEDPRSLAGVRAALDETHEGMDEVKDEIGLYVLSQIEAAVKDGRSLLLVGPAGVGKTTLAETVARALGRRFVRVPLGGVDDEAEIKGHRRTYIGAMPGRIAQGRQRAGSVNEVMLLDEIDKMTKGSHGNPSAALLGLLDDQKRDFRDHYMDVGMDFRRTLFIATANSLEDVDPTLRNRFIEVHIGGYTTEEKVAIGVKKVLPGLKAELGLEGKVSLGDEAALVRRLAEGYTREAGVRQLKAQLQRVLLKALHEWSLNRTAPVAITPAKIEEYLGDAYEPDTVREVDDTHPGEAVALATGGIVFVQSNILETGQPKADLSFQVTGNVQKLMQESVQVAFRAVQSRLGQGVLKGLKAEDFRGRKLFLHIPGGAVPKDGTAAGLAAGVSIASRLSGRTVSPDAAFSGELDNYGRVLPVNSLKHRLLGFRAGGAKTVYMPLENKEDLESLLMKTTNLNGIIREGDRLSMLIPRETLKGLTRTLRSLKIAATQTPMGVRLSGPSEKMREFLSRLPGGAELPTYVLVSRLEEVLEAVLLPAEPESPSDARAPPPSSPRAGFATLGLLLFLSASALIALALAPHLAQTLPDLLAAFRHADPAWWLTGAVFAAGSVYVPGPGGHLAVLRLARRGEDEEAQTKAVKDLLNADTADSRRAADLFFQLLALRDRARAGRLFGFFSSIDLHSRRLAAALTPETLGRLMHALRQDAREEHVRLLRMQLDQSRRLLEGVEKRVSGMSRLKGDALVKATAKDRRAFLEQADEAIAAQQAQIKRLQSQVEQSGAPAEDVYFTDGDGRQVSARQLIEGLSRAADEVKSRRDAVEKDARELVKQLREQVEAMENSLEESEDAALDAEFPEMSPDGDKLQKAMSSRMYVRVVERMQDLIRAMDSAPALREKVPAVWRSYMGHRRLEDLLKEGLARDVGEAVASGRSEPAPDAAYLRAARAVAETLGYRTERALSLVAPSRTLQKAIPASVARHLLEDESLPPGRRTQRVLAVDFNHVSSDPGEAIAQILNVLHAAQGSGRTAVMLDLDLLLAKFRDVDVAGVFERLMADWREFDAPRVPLLFYGTETAHLFLREHSNEYGRVVRRHTLKFDSEEELMARELADIEAFHGVSFARKAFAQVKRYVTGAGGRLDLRLAIITLERSAARAYLDGRTQVTADDAAAVIDGLERQRNVSITEEEKYRVEINRMPEHVRKVALQELARLHHMRGDSAEREVVLNYLDNLVRTPWTETTEDPRTVAGMRAILDETHEGMDQAKHEIELFLTRKIEAAVKSGKNILLAGPAGVGKTTLAESVSRALGRRFVRVSLGGVDDEAEIKGHRRTYIGAMPGRIAQGRQRAGSVNEVMLLDEIDKMTRGRRGNPSAALLGLLDDQKKDFHDHYMDVGMDYTQTLFIATANVLEDVDPTLRDRFEIIRLGGYTAEEKVGIGLRKVLPALMAELGLEGKVVLDDEAALVRRIAEGYTREAGVRQLKVLLQRVLLKALHEWSVDRAAPVTVTLEKIEQYLGPAGRPDVVRDEVQRVPGEAVGMAYSTYGGSILFIQANSFDTGRRDEEVKLVVTGNIHQVMQESAQIAFDYVRSQFGKPGSLQDIRPDQFNGRVVSVHVPEGAIPKDGPSAGGAFTTAFVSLFTQRLVRADVSMTGELDNYGHILAIGGVKEKVLSALNAGVKLIFLPAGNRKDIFKAMREQENLRGLIETDGRQALVLPRHVPTAGAGEEGAREAAAWNESLQVLLDRDAEFAARGVTVAGTADGILIESTVEGMRGFLAERPELDPRVTYVLVKRAEEIWAQAIPPDPEDGGSAEGGREPPTGGSSGVEVRVRDLLGRTIASWRPPLAGLFERRSPRPTGAGPGRASRARRPGSGGTASKAFADALFHHSAAAVLFWLAFPPLAALPLLLAAVTAHGLSVSRRGWASGDAGRLAQDLAARGVVPTTAAPDWSNRFRLAGYDHATDLISVDPHLPFFLQRLFYRHEARHRALRDLTGGRRVPLLEEFVVTLWDLAGAFDLLLRGPPAPNVTYHPFGFRPLPGDRTLRARSLARDISTAGAVRAARHRGRARGLTDKREVARLKLEADGDVMDAIEDSLDGRETLFTNLEGAKDGARTADQMSTVGEPRRWKRALNRVLGRIHYLAVDPIEGTNATVFNETDGSGASTPAVVNDSLRKLRLPNVYADLVVAAAPGSLDLDPDRPVMSNLREIARANEVGLDGLEVVIIGRPRELARYRAMLPGVPEETLKRMTDAKQLRREVVVVSPETGLTVRAIPDGTFHPALLAGLGGTLTPGKRLVFYGSSGAPEAMENLAALAALGDGSAGLRPSVALRVISLNTRDTEDPSGGGKYSFSAREDVRESAEIRAMQGRRAEAILSGRRLFTMSDIRGRVDASVPFITDNAVFGLTGVEFTASDRATVTRLIITRRGTRGHAWLEQESGLPAGPGRPRETDRGPPSAARAPSWSAGLLVGGLVTLAGVWAFGWPGLAFLLAVPGRLWYVLLARSGWSALTVAMQEQEQARLTSLMQDRFDRVEIFDFPGERSGLRHLLTSPQSRLMPLVFTASPDAAARPVLYVHRGVAFALSPYNDARAGRIAPRLTRAVAETLLSRETAGGRWPGFPVGNRLPAGLTSPDLVVLRGVVGLSDLPQSLWRRWRPVRSFDPAEILLAPVDLTVSVDRDNRPVMTLEQRRALAAALGLYASRRNDPVLSENVRALLARLGLAASPSDASVPATPLDPLGADRPLLHWFNLHVPPPAQATDDFVDREDAEQAEAYRRVDRFLESYLPKVGIPRWPLSFEHLRLSQRFLNGFMGRAVHSRPELRSVAAALRGRGLKLSEKAVDYLSVPYSAATVTELKRLGFRLDEDEWRTGRRAVFRHLQGMFYTVRVNDAEGRRPIDADELLRPVAPQVLRDRIDPEALDMKNAYGVVQAGLAGEVEVSDDLDDAQRAEVHRLVADMDWPEVELVEDHPRSWAGQEFPFLPDEDVAHVEVGLRVGSLEDGRRALVRSGALDEAAAARFAPAPGTEGTDALLRVWREAPGTAPVGARIALVEREGDVVLYKGFDETRAPASDRPPFFRLRRALARGIVAHLPPFLLVIGPVRVARLLTALVGRDRARLLFIEQPDGPWLDHTPMGAKFRATADGVLGAGAWKYFVDHRTLRFTGEVQVPLVDRLLRPLKRLAALLPLVDEPAPPSIDFDLARETLRTLGFEERERYSPPGTDWEAQVMWIRDQGHTAFFLDKPLTGRRGKVALFSAIWRGLSLFGEHPLPRAYAPPLPTDRWEWDQVVRRVGMVGDVRDAYDRAYLLREWRRWLDARIADGSAGAADRLLLSGWIEAGRSQPFFAWRVRWSATRRVARALVRSVFLLGPTPNFYHHLAQEGVFEDIGVELSQADDTIIVPKGETLSTEQLNNAFIARFSKKPWRRQAFSLESRIVAPWMVALLYMAGRVTREELLNIFQNAAQNGGRALTVEGSHYENIDRRLGLQAFDQGRVDVAIRTSSELKGAERSESEPLFRRLFAAAAWLTRFYLRGDRDPASWTPKPPSGPTDGSAGGTPSAPRPPSEPPALRPGVLLADMLEPAAALAPRASYVSEEGTDVVAFDWNSLRQVWTTGLFLSMQAQVEQAERAGRPNKLVFAFVSDQPGLTAEAMQRALAKHGMPESLRRSVIAVDAGALAAHQVSVDGVIQVSRLSRLLAERLFDRWNSGSLRLRVVVDEANAARWQGEALKVLLTPAGTGEIVSTSLGLMVALDGGLSDRLLRFIDEHYPREMAEQIRRQVERDGRVLLPAMPVKPQTLEEKVRQSRILDIQA